MDRCGDAFIPREDDLSDSSSIAEPEAVDLQSLPYSDEINPNRDSNNGPTPSSNINTISVIAESALITEAKQIRLDKFHSNKLCTSAAAISTSTSPSFSLTRIRAHGLRAPLESIRL